MILSRALETSNLQALLRQGETDSRRPGDVKQSIWAVVSKLYMCTV